MLQSFYYFVVAGKNQLPNSALIIWKSVEQDQRYHMLEDLYAKVELIGMSADEVDYELEYGSEL